MPDINTEESKLRQLMGCADIAVMAWQPTILLEGEVPECYINITLLLK